MEVVTKICYYSITLKIILFDLYSSDLKRLNPQLVEVRSIDVAKLLNSVGVLHSKLLIADRKHFYLGSANLSDRE